MGNVIAGVGRPMVVPGATISGLNPAFPVSVAFKGMARPLRAGLVPGAGICCTLPLCDGWNVPAVQPVIPPPSKVPLEPVALGGGLLLTLLAIPGKVPLYLEDRHANRPETGPNYAAMLEANGRRVIIAPACADITDAVRRQLDEADLLFFDGTLFTDDEMIKAGLGEKTGRRMGHVPVSGPGGTLEGLADLRCRRVLVHINNSNPILLLDSPERRQVEAVGFEVAYDGMEVQL